MPKVCEFHEGGEGESTKCQCECCECQKSVSSMRGVRVSLQSGSVSVVSAKSL